MMREESIPGNFRIRFSPSPKKRSLGLCVGVHESKFSKQVNQRLFYQICKEMMPESSKTAQ